MTTSNSFLIIAGEASSDHYGATLVAELRKQSPKCYISALGGAQLSQSVDTFLGETTTTNAVGAWEAFRGNSQFNKIKKALVQHLDGAAIDTAIIIDFPHYNFKIARILQKRNIRIVTYITPNFWLWENARQAKQICAYSGAVITIFEKEYHFYRQFSDKIHYFGHPLTTVITPAPPKRFSGHITLFPGSRYQELRYLFPVMCDSITRLDHYRDLTLSVGISEERFVPYITDTLATYGLSATIVLNDSEALLDQTDVALACAGTTALELALHEIPAVIIGRISWITYFIGHYLLRIKLPFIALPNIIMDKIVVPEHKQFLRPEEIATNLTPLVTDEAKREVLRRNYATLRNTMMADSQHFQKIAAIVLGPC